MTETPPRDFDLAIRRKLGVMYEPDDDTRDRTGGPRGARRSGAGGGRGDGPERGRLKPGPKPHEGLDEVDLGLLRALNQDARKSYRDLAKELGIALSTVSARIKRLENDGIVRGYVPLIDPTKLGLDLTVVVGVKIGHGKLLDAQRRIAKLAEVFAVYDTTGDWDALIMARFRDRAELNAFVKALAAMPAIERTGTQLVLNTVKEEPRVLV